MSHGYYGQADRELGAFIGEEAARSHAKHNMSRGAPPDQLDEGKKVTAESLKMDYPSSAHNKGFDALEKARKEYEVYFKKVSSAAQRSKDPVLVQAAKEADQVMTSLHNASVRWRNAETALYRRRR